jgi:hypothetical protein
MSTRIEDAPRRPDLMLPQPPPVPSIPERSNGRVHPGFPRFRQWRRFSWLVIGYNTFWIGSSG